MKSIRITIFTVLLSILLVSQSVNAHCEVPCGIYGDSIRVSLMLEHIQTIEKAMITIDKLSNSDEINYNQIVRWVVNKEEHANKIQEIVSQYFLHQRIKPVDSTNKMEYEKYLNQLSKLHEILVYSMKSKQSTDTNIIDKLRNAVNDFSGLYFHKH
jgi:nickel superoxide dismutase